MLVYKKITQGSVLAPYFEKMVDIVNQGPYESNLVDKIPKLSINEIKNRVKQMGDLEKFTQEMNAKKDDLLKKERMTQVIEGDRYVFILGDGKRATRIKESILYFEALDAIINVPTILFQAPSQGLISTIGTCLYAAA